MTSYRLQELADLVEGRVQGDVAREVTSVNTLATAGPHELSFLSDSRYRAQANASLAGAVMVSEAMVEAGLQLTSADGSAKDLLVVDDPAMRMTTLVRMFFPPHGRDAGIDPTAVIEAGCDVHATAHIGPYVVIGAGSRIGAGAVVHASVVIGRGCRVGERCVLHPHVVLYDDTELGEGVEVHAGTTLGSDGFGYTTRGGVHHKVPQVGRVVVEPNVEIGANSVVDRATFGETRIGTGTKIDNLVQIGHNVQVGRSCILCGQAGVAGSSHLGDGVVLAGQVGVADHCKISAGTQVAAKSAVLQDIEGLKVVGGIPAGDLREWQRQQVGLRRLQDLGRRLRAMEQALDELKERTEDES